MNLGDREYTLDGTGPFTVTYDNKTLNADDLPNVKEVTNENVPIPEGFYYVGGTKDEGVVISDVEGDDLDNSGHGNQFVWVPVNQNQKLTLEVTSKEDITEIVVIQPDGAKTTIEARGKTYNGEITMTKNGVYEVEVKTATNSKTASKRVTSLYAQDVEFSIIPGMFWFQTEASEKYNTVSELLKAKGVDSIETLLSESGCESIEEYMGTNGIYIEELKEEIKRLMRAGFRLNEDHNQNPESVNKYGGYYIGRYEAGDGTTTVRRDKNSLETNTLVSKKGAYVYNYISNNSAKSLSSGMYSGNGAITSQVITGAGWNRTLNWIIETGGKTETEVLIDSSSWGNYDNSTGPRMQDNSEYEEMNYTTGRSEYWKVNNIYDLAGNTNEWTQETDTEETYQRTIYGQRGGDFEDRGNDAPAVNLIFSYPGGPSYNCSFRVQLYINI